MIVIEANYSKKLGLPEFSSHQYSITLRSEVSDLSKVEQESDRLYGLLQSCVDHSLQQAGFVPNGKNGHRNGNGNGNGDHWDCTPKQKELILKIVDENRMDKTGVEKTSQELFGKPVRSLNKMEASGLIEELLRQSGAVNGNGKSRFQTTGAR